MMGRIKCGEMSLILNISWPPTFSPLTLGMPPPLWKRVKWPADAAKMGYRWKVGVGSKIRFWEDNWFGTCSLAIQYWEIFSIANEHGCTIREAWDELSC
jgi:hypothetical protein